VTRNLQLAAWLMAGIFLGNLLGNFVHAQAYLTATEVPRGTILMMMNACPGGYAEVSSLNGAMPYGTIAANGDAGGTGGSNTITPTGSISTPAFSGNSATLTGSVSQPTFTGNAFTSVINHTHTVTVTYDVQGGTTAATTGTHVMTSTATGGSARVPTSGDVVSATTANPGGGVSSITPAGTVSQPTLTMNSYTPAGTVTTPTMTGNSFDNRPAFVKVIFCQKS
jgi:hypothetical protein